MSEREPTPEKPEIEIVNRCDECGNHTFLNDKNTIMFQGEDNKWYAYVRCDNECDPETIEITPDVIEYFSYLTNWYTQEGKVSDVEWTGVVLGQAAVSESVEVIDVPTWEQITLAQIQYAEPFEYANDHEHKRWVR